MCQLQIKYNLCTNGENHKMSGSLEEGKEGKTGE